MRVRALVLGLVLFTVPAAADPANYGRVVSFGDSLSDNGNLAAFGVAPAPPYYFGRFSNGPTWVEILAGPGGANGLSSQQQFWVNFVTNTPLNGGSVNVALGGARADSGPNSNGPIPGVPTQIAAYEFYSTLSGQTPFKPTDLVTLLAGANDIFQGYAAASLGGPTGLQTLGTNTATSVTSDLNQLISGGARTILLANLPNIGATPLFQGTGQAAGGQTVTLTFNQALNVQTQIAAAANPGVNIIQMDLYALNNVIRSNPLAFGFTNITDECILTPSCNKVTAAGFAFWDEVHPTEAVHQLFARYAALLLSTEETGKAVSALTQLALSNRLDSSDILFRRGISPLGPTPTGLYAEIIGSTASFNGTNFATYGSTAYDYSLGGFRVGFDGASGPVAFGSSFAYQSGSISGDALSSKISTSQLDAYALTRFGSIFAGLEGGFSFDNFDNIRRNTGFPTVMATGDTRGASYSFAGTLGTQYQLGRFLLTPAFRLGYASVNLDGFTENAPILALQYSNQDISTGFWTSRLRASTPFPWGNAIAYGELGYERLFSTSENYTAKLAFNTAHAVTLGEDVQARGFFLKTGIGGRLSTNLLVSGEYELSTQNGAGDIHSGRLRLTIPIGGEGPGRD